MKRFITTGAMTEVARQAAAIARRNSPVVILGATGVGKTCLAEFIHQQSDRSKGPFVVVNCGSIPQGLVENELFGHEKGAYTDADGSAKGVFEQAHGGTLLLDEVGELPLGVQAALLRVINKGKVKKVGGEQEIEVDVRLVFATNRSLEVMVNEGEFRRDLYYRIAVLELTLPTLKDRRADIRDLANAYLEECSDEVGLSDEALELLVAHSWPGNVRELENVLERALLQVELNPSELILPSHIQIQGGITPMSDNLSVSGNSSSGVFTFSVDTSSRGETGLHDFVGTAVERQLILFMLERNDWNVSRTARAIGRTRTYLTRMIKKHGIKRPA